MNSGKSGDTKVEGIIRQIIFYRKKQIISSRTVAPEKDFRFFGGLPKREREFAQRRRNTAPIHVGQSLALDSVDNAGAKRRARMSRHRFQ
jgi:hypothetical protein